MSETHEGYENYETWHTALMIDNERGAYNHWYGMARGLLDDPSEIRSMFSGVLDDDPTALVRAVLADRLESEHEERRPELDDPTFSALLTSAFGRINWYEVAENILSGAQEMSAS